MEIVLAGDAGELQRALDHAERRVAVAVHDAVAQRAVVRADAQGAAEALGLQHERGELLLDALQLLGVRVVGVFLDGELLGVGVVAGVHADLLDPLHGLHRGLGLEVDVGHDRHLAALGAELADDVLQIGRILHRGGGDAHDLAADGHEIQRLPHRGGGVHGVAGDHGLLHDRLCATDDDTAVRGITHHDFAGGPT